MLLLLNRSPSYKSNEVVRKHFVYTEKINETYNFGKCKIIIIKKKIKIKKNATKTHSEHTLIDTVRGAGQPQTLTNNEPPERKQSFFFFSFFFAEAKEEIDIKRLTMIVYSFSRQNIFGT